MLKRTRLLAALAASVLLLCALCAAAFAHEVPDLSRQGSIQITMRSGGAAVSGGSLTLYRVGEIRQDDGNYSFVLTEAFAGSQVSLENLETAQPAKTLSQYATAQKLTGVTKTIGKDGTVSFPELEPGLYLLVQKQAAGGYEEAEPFLVSIPLKEDGVYVYDVDASPKVELETVPAPTKPTTPPDPTLPQTGQLNWPVPVLVVLGLGLFSTGWILRSGKKDHEK